MDFQQSPDSTAGQPNTNPVWDVGRRASKACDNCRQKKIKCDTSQPACRYCRRRKLACYYRKDDQPARDPTLHLILEKLTQVHDEFRTLDGRVNKIENATAASNQQRPNAAPSSPQFSGQGSAGISAQASKTSRRPEASQTNKQNLNAGQRISPAGPSPTSSMLQWKIVRDLHPTVSNRYLQDDLSFAYSATGAPPVMSPTAMTHPQNERGQVFFHIRNFLDLVYPLYPIICEQAIYDMVTVVIRDGVQSDISSALVLLMTTLGKLYSRTYDLLEHSLVIADLDSTVRLLSWLPLQHSLEHAQAYTLAALCFAKLSMLSTSAFYLRQSSAILFEFLMRRVLVPSAIKVTTRTTSVRLYWVVLNMERDLSWETNIYSKSQLSNLEHRLPLPFECMIEESSSPDSGQMHTSPHSVIDSCYSLFLAETSLRQIIWRVSTAPELQESSLNFESGTTKSTSLNNNMLLSSLKIITELETQFSEWLACIPVSAAWTPIACTGQITPLRSRIRIQYWFGRFNLYKASLYHILNNQYHSQATDSLTLTWVHSAVNAAFNAIGVFISENFMPDDIFTHRIFILTIILRSAISALGIAKVASFCSTVTTALEVLIQRSITRLGSLSLSSSSQSPLNATTNHYNDTPLGEMRLQSRWLTEDLRNFHADGKNFDQGINDAGNVGLRHLLA